MYILASSIVAVFLLSGCSGHGNSDGQGVKIAAAEAFVDTFYSFDAEKLKSTLSSAQASLPDIAYYQGWAAGGNYTIVNRMPCILDGAASVSCSITVKDDLMGALGIAFNVTDTFHLTFNDGQISSVQTSSNDLPVFEDAKKWVWRERPELVNEPCKGYFDGGPTPEQCVQAMVRGFSEFAASDEFPDPPE